ncbi:hypothetical protein SLS54_002061 [Diplodia seriata]
MSITSWPPVSTFATCGTNSVRLILQLPLNAFPTSVLRLGPNARYNREFVSSRTATATAANGEKEDPSSV